MTNSPIYGVGIPTFLQVLSSSVSRRVLGSITAIFMPNIVTPASAFVAPYYSSLLRIPPLGRAIADGGSVSPTFPPSFHQSRQDNRADVSQTFPIKIVVHGRRIALRVSAVKTQVQSPLSKFVLRLVGFLVATHVFNHMSGVSQRAGKDNQDRGYFSQAKNGRNSNVRR